MNYSKEIIWHFTCYFCKGWWSIASDDDWQPNTSENFYCTHCGRNQKNSATLKVLIDAD